MFRILLDGDLSKEPAHPADVKLLIPTACGEFQTDLERPGCPARQDASPKKVPPNTRPGTNWVASYNGSIEATRSAPSRARPARHQSRRESLRALPIFLAKRCRLVDSAVLRQQLTSLERHVSGTREAVSHPNVASAHDDLATAVCGALVVPGNRLAFDQILPVGRWRTDRRRRNR